MKRTREGRAISFFEAAQNRTAVRAGVGQRIELAVLAPRDDYGLAPDVNSHKVIDVRNLAFVGEVDPVTLKDVLEFQLEKLLVGESGPIKLIDMVYRVFVQHRLELCDTISVACAHLNHAGLLLTNHADLLFTFGIKRHPRAALQNPGVSHACAQARAAWNIRCPCDRRRSTNASAQLGGWSAKRRTAQRMRFDHVVSSTEVCVENPNHICDAAFVSSGSSGCQPRPR